MTMRREISSDTSFAADTELDGFAMRPQPNISREDLIDTLLGGRGKDPALQAWAVKSISSAYDEREPRSTDVLCALAHVAFTTDEYELMCTALRAISHIDHSLGARVALICSYKDDDYQGSIALAELRECDPVLAGQRAAILAKASESRFLKDIADEIMSENSSIHLAEPSGLRAEDSSDAVIALYGKSHEEQSAAFRRLQQEDRQMTLCVASALASSYYPIELRDLGKKVLSEHVPELAAGIDRLKA